MANANINENCACALLGTTSSINMNQNTTLIELYTVPANKRAIVTMVVLRDPSATLAGCNDVDFGVGTTAAVESFLNNETGIGDMTATTDYMVLTAASDEYTIIDGDDSTAAKRTFSMYLVTGSTGSATATVDVFGYLFDS